MTSHLCIQFEIQGQEREQLIEVEESIAARMVELGYLYACPAHGYHLNPDYDWNVIAVASLVMGLVVNFEQLKSKTQH